MAVSIRLRRMGRKKQPHYRVVVADSRKSTNGRFVESLGYYRPLTEPARLVLDLERVEYWLGQGAIPSDTVRALIKRARHGGDDPRPDPASLRHQEREIGRS
jgi:small subunit ribosomal protein S16